MVELVVAVKCPCGDCSTWGLNLGTFYQGCGWDEDTARRFAAAWNACKGIPTETLEGNTLPELADIVADAKREATAEEAMRLLRNAMTANWNDADDPTLKAARAFLEAHDG